MYRVGVSDRLRALHALRGDFGEESRTHAHEYRVEWTCSCLSLDENGFSVDLAVMAEELGRLLRGLEGKDLNELEFFRQTAGQRGEPRLLPEPGAVQGSHPAGLPGVRDRRVGGAHPGIGGRLGLLQRPALRSLNLLLVLYGPLERLTGGTLYDRRMVEFLRGRGHRVTVRSLGRWPYALSPLQSLDPRLWRALADPGWDCILLDELVHPALAPAAALRAALPAGSRARHRGAPAAGRGAARPGPPGRQRLESWLLRSSDFIVANSRATARMVRERVGRRVPVRVCPPGLERPAPPRAAPDRRGRPGHGGRPGRARPPCVLSVANLAPIKGQDLLVEALAPLAALPWRLELVGGEADPRFRRRLEARVRRLGLQDRVRWRGPLRGAELERAWREADLFVLPSRMETYGMALAEALAHGLPCVAFDTGGVREVLTGGGLLVPAGDPAALRRALAGLLAVPGAARPAGRRGARGRRPAAGLGGERPALRAHPGVFLLDLAPQVE